MGGGHIVARRGLRQLAAGGVVRHRKLQAKDGHGQEDEREDLGEHEYSVQFVGPIVASSASPVCREVSLAEAITDGVADLWHEGAFQVSDHGPKKINESYEEIFNLIR